VLLGRDATETAFKAQPVSQYSIIHLAVHAIADSRYPDRSALVLAPDQPPEDGLLQVREISRLHLNADLVTLSACETGIGMTEGEAGVISLERAFLMGGAKAVVATLWNVEDHSTSALMEAFYRHLAEREDKATALAQAKRELMRKRFTPLLILGQASLL
jgi:CHAT domain-containing protein